MCGLLIMEKEHPKYPKKIGESTTTAHVEFRKTTFKDSKKVSSL